MISKHGVIVDHLDRIQSVHVEANESRCAAVGECILVALMMASGNTVRRQKEIKVEQWERGAGEARTITPKNRAV